MDFVVSDFPPAQLKPQEVEVMRGKLRASELDGLANPTIPGLNIKRASAALCLPSRLMAWLHRRRFAEARRRHPLVCGARAP